MTTKTRDLLEYKEQACIILDARIVDNGTRPLYDIQIIGAQLPLSVDISDIKRMLADHPAPAGKTLFDLAQYAAIKWDLDPARIMKAVEIVLAFAITKAPDCYHVAGSKISKPNHRESRRNNIYATTVKSCSCPDRAENNRGICKHRIAVWMYEEIEKDRESRALGTLQTRTIYSLSYCLQCCRVHWQQRASDGNLICIGIIDPMRNPALIVIDTKMTTKNHDTYIVTVENRNYIQNYIPEELPDLTPAEAIDDFTFTLENF